MTNIKHNNRSMSDQEFQDPAHRHILREFSDDNIYLRQENLKEVYQELFGVALEEYNAKQKRSDRQIKDFYKHVQKSDTLDLQREFIVTLGSKDDWDRVPREEKLKAGHKLAEYVEEFNERHPNLRMYNAVVHLDEAGAPHAHFNVVPVATGYKNGLKVKPSFSKALKQEGYKGIARELLRDFKDKEVALIREKLEEIGHEHFTGLFRNDFRDMREYKQAMREMDAALEVRKEEIQNEIDQVKNQVKNEVMKLETLESEIKKYDHVQMETRVEGSQVFNQLKESTKAPFGMRLVSDDLLKRALKYLATIHNKFVMLSKSNIRLTKENEELRKDNQVLKSEVEEYKEFNRKNVWKRANEKQEQEQKISRLERELASTIEFLEDRFALLQIARNVVGEELMSKVMEEYNRINEQERERENHSQKRSSHDLER